MEDAEVRGSEVALVVIGGAALLALGAFLVLRRPSTVLGLEVGACYTVTDPLGETGVLKVVSVTTAPQVVYVFREYLGGPWGEPYSVTESELIAGQVTFTKRTCPGLL